MSLSTNISDVVTTIATSVKGLRTFINGNDNTGVTRLGTTATTLVDAINEVKTTADSAAGGGVAIDDTQVRTDATYSSDKIVELDTALQGAIDAKPDVNDAATTSATDTWSVDKITAELGSVEVDLTDLIDDVTPSTTTVYSSTHTDSQITTAINDLKGGASAAYDTLVELQGEITDNDSAIAGLTTSIGEKVAYVSQTLTAPQQTQARTNIGAASAADLTTLTTAVGATEPSPSFVETFNAGLV